MRNDQEVCSSEVESLWRWALTDRHYGRLARWPSDARCTICSTPFAGIAGRIAAITGWHRSHLNPHLCNYCEDKLPPGGAEVDVAVLFADIRGSTQIAEQMSSRDYTFLINQFYDIASTAIIRQRGVIDKLIGDEVMAFFVPANDSDPDGLGYRRHAVRAGREILERTHDLFGNDQTQLPVAVGVHAGPAFVGKVGREGINAFTAMGDTVNIAARLRSEALAGEMLLGERIYRTVEDELPGAEQQTITVRGRASPLDVFRYRPNAPE
jgi:adenylate cyclase